jgi:hypothetical protein
MRKQNKFLPEFRNEQKEREFWATHDSTEFIDWEKAETAIFPDLKLSMKTIIPGSSPAYRSLTIE